MARLERELAAGQLHPRETLFVAGSFGTVNAEVILPCDGASSFAIDLRGTFSQTIEISGTVDGTNWMPIPVRPVNQAAIRYVAAIVGAVQGVWVGKPGPYRSIRARCTAFTSGSATVTLVASTAPLDDTLQGMVTPDVGTSTGAAGAAVTLTLAAPGAGLRHYITYLSINKFASALLTAASAPIVVTTTNLPGSIAFSLPADGALAGTMFPWREDFAYAVASSAQNTATTVVCPLTTGVIWRVTAGYYIAP